MFKDIKAQMAHVRSFRRKTLVPSQDELLWELFGVCLGDGCLSRCFNRTTGYTMNFTIFTGNGKDDFEYYTTYLAPSLRSKFNIKVTPYLRKDSNSIAIRINNQSVFYSFKKLGMPIGKKKEKIEIPPIMFKKPKRVKAAVLRGLLDTDGCIFARRDEAYKYLHIKITSANESFLYQIKKLMGDFNLPAYVHWQGRHGGDVIVRGNSNIKRWMALIGTSHPLIKQRYIGWLDKGVLLPKGS